MAVRGSGTPNRELLATVVDSIDDNAIFALDADGLITYWSSGAVHLTGSSADDAIGRHHSFFYGPEAIATHRPERILGVAVRDGRYSGEGWRQRRDGRPFFANVSMTAMRDADGTLTGFCGITRDVTDRHLAEQALRESEAQLRSITEAATDAIVSIDGDGRIVSFNGAATRLYGWSASEAIGSSAEMLVPESVRDEAIEVLRRRATSHAGAGDAPPVQGMALHRDGHEIPVEITVGAWVLEGVRHFTGVVRDVTERTTAEARLRHLADHDALTGLFNRHRFEAELERIVCEADRYGRAASLLVLDLDGFKEINDRHGHSVGDELIAKVGSLLVDLVRETDVIGRLGGDEFGIVLQETDAAGAQVIAEVLTSAIRTRGIVVGIGVRANVTASIGITELHGGDHQTAQELLVEADSAMYEAKALGRNRNCVWRRDPTRRARERERRSWLVRLRRALDEDLFELHAQPIVGIATEDRSHFELLLRLCDDGEEPILPSAFLDDAERFDLIGEIDRWVLQRAVELLHDHHHAGHDVAFTVNLSGKTMTDESIVDDLREMLVRRPVPRGRLIVEVTETAAIVNLGRAAELATELRELGCDFALDDFGSGFASLLYLKHLNFDYLKIDGEFIARLVDTPADQLVVRAVVDIARGLGTRTIAEFVPDEQTMTLLDELGVDYGQGYHLGRPRPLAESLPVAA